jgi:hypothetical protein
MERVGAGSLSVIVPVPVPAEMVAFTGALRTTEKFSLPSKSASSLVGIEMVVLVLPAGIVPVPFTAAV